MDPVEDRQVIEVIDPAHFVLTRLEYLLLLPSQGGERLDDPVLNGLAASLLHGGEDIQAELPVVGALLDKGEPSGRAKPGPHFAKLARQDSSEDRTDADICEKVPRFADFCPRPDA